MDLIKIFSLILGKGGKLTSEYYYFNILINMVHYLDLDSFPQKSTIKIYTSILDLSKNLHEYYLADLLYDMIWDLPKEIYRLSYSRLYSRSYGINQRL